MSTKWYYKEGLFSYKITISNLYNGSVTIQFEYGQHIEIYKINKISKFY
jgi:hypothetical protein